MRYLLSLLCAVLFSCQAYAHEIRPAFLELEEIQAETFQLSWKQPITEGRRLELDPVLPEACDVLTEVQSRIIETAVVARWQVSCALREGLISIAGLDRTLTDVFIEVRYLDGEVKRLVVRPGEAGLELSEHSSSGAFAYLRLGVEHILSGPDHLLFVLGLLLLARLRQLLFVITAFTLAHSLTLGLTSLGWVSLATGPVELMIALSILLLAVEAIRVMDGQPSYTAKRPWVVSFGFGLLHGFGFAGALGEIGLPRGAELLALFYFNIGVEVGQLLFIGGLLTLAFILNSWLKAGMQTVRRLMAYGVGIAGAFWVFERLSSTFTV